MYSGRLTDEIDIRALEQRATNLWFALPPAMRLQGHPEALQETTYKPLTREIMLNSRLTFLQVLFLLHGGASDLGHRSPAVFEVAEEMLALVVWSIVFRDRLVLSSTAIVWKVSPIPATIAHVSNQI